MPRRPRIILPDRPHHVTQRGVRKQDIFFEHADYRAYLAMAREILPESGLKCWAYCLMPNHVHWVLEPKTPQSLSNAIRALHRKYALRINKRENWSGALWQDRFYSCPMSPTHALRAVRYVELNPVRAGLTGAPQDWPWSSARSHLASMTPSPLSEIAGLSEIKDWRAYLDRGLSDRDLTRIGLHTQSGLPLGEDDWLEALELELGKPVRPLRNRSAYQVPKRA